LFADNSQTRPVGLCRVLYNLFYSSELGQVQDGIIGADGVHASFWAPGEGALRELNAQYDRQPQ